MKHTVWIPVAALIAAGVLIAQAPVGQPAAAQAKGAPKGQAAKGTKAPAPNPAASPASRRVPPTVTAQTYASDLIKAGEAKFTGQCGFCHGRDAAGGEGGSDLTRSELVATDTRGDKIGPVVRQGKPDLGMPSFTMTDAELNSVVAFIHDQKTKSEAVSGGRQAVDVSDLSTGNADAGKRYFNAAGSCATCHSPTGDLAGIATRMQGLALLQRMLYPTAGRPAPAPARVTFTLTTGQTVVAPLAGVDEFSISVFDPTGARQTYQRSAVKFEIKDPITAHFDQLGKYTDTDMHNVYAYLATLK